MNKEQALEKIEELKKYVNDIDTRLEKDARIAIDSRFDTTTIIYQSNKTNMRDAVIEAVENGASLRDADLRGVSLTHANLRGATLRDADLSHANLRDANLSGCDLFGARLLGADLRGAELREAKFYGRGGIVRLTRSQLPDFLTALGFVLED